MRAAPAIVIGVLGVGAILVGVWCLKSPSPTISVGGIPREKAPEADDGSLLRVPPDDNPSVTIVKIGRSPELELTDGVADEGQVDSSGDPKVKTGNAGDVSTTDAGADRTLARLVSMCKSIRIGENRPEDLESRAACQKLAEELIRADPRGPQSIECLRIRSLISSSCSDATSSIQRLASEIGMTDWERNALEGSALRIWDQRKDAITKYRDAVAADGISPTRRLQLQIELGTTMWEDGDASGAELALQDVIAGAQAGGNKKLEAIAKQRLFGWRGS